MRPSLASGSQIHQFESRVAGQRSVMKEKIGQLEAQLVRRTSARTALFTNAPDLYGPIFLVVAGDTGNRHILRAEPEDFAHVVVAHAAFAAPIWNQLTGVLQFP